jgi:RNA polymerase sigma-70 factor (ECF subfamily)
MGERPSSAGASAKLEPAFPVGLLLGPVLLAAFLLELRNLDHTALTRWDEVFHAIVAQNVLKHPLEPTLIDVPYLPYQRTNWKENRVWLHKPILPFWQIALSFAVLGVDTFALRLPSAILSMGAAWLTYLIGKRLLDRRAALIAAVLQASSPFLMQLVHGYQFADHIDVALLFWVEVGIWFLVRALRTGHWRDVLLAGVAQGLAYLCKSYLALIVFGVAVTAWLLPVCGFGKREDSRIGVAHLLGLMGATLLTVAPWLLWCLSSYPDEFLHEHTQVLKHLHANVEGWGAPWDRVLFDYLVGIYGVFYGPVLVALAVLLGRALVRRHTGLLLVCAWGLGVMLPHLFAASKTPSATLLAVPAFMLLLGFLIAEASRGERWSLVALTAVLALSFVFPAVIKGPGYGSPVTRAFGGVMRQALWVVGQVAGALAILALAGVAAWLAGKRLPASGRAVRYLRWAAVVFCGCVLVWRGIDTVKAGWRVTERDVNDPACEDVGLFARDHLPENAVLLCEETRGAEHLTTMFYADRTCYAVAAEGHDDVARRIVKAGGTPYLVSRRKVPLAVVHVSGAGATVYLWRDSARAGGGGKVAGGVIGFGGRGVQNVGEPPRVPMAEIPPTRASLLLRLRDLRDEAAWGEFVDLYGSVVYGFVRKQGLQDADAADLAQEVLRAVAGAVGRLDYDPKRGSFRNWLFTIVRNKLSNWRRAQRHRLRDCDERVAGAILEQCPAPGGQEAEWEAEWEQRVFAWACEQVRRTVTESTWQAFWRTAIEDQPGKQVAADLGLSVAAVYQAHGRVLARLKELVRSAQEP